MKSPVALLSVLLLLLTACSSTRHAWDTRIGTYTFNDAVQELGVPEATFTHADGSFTAEWLNRRGSTEYVRAFPLSTHSRNRYSTPSPYHVHRTPDTYLLLTFDAEERLKQVQQRNR